MNLKLKRNKGFYLAFGALILCLILGVNFYAHIKQTSPVKKAQALGDMKQGSLEAIEADLPDVINHYGVTAALGWVRKGFAAKTINMFQCHTMTHLIGHRSLYYYGGDVQAAINGQPIDECEGGYVHGVEAQLVESGGDYRPGLFKICNLILQKPSYGGCYHGAGHGFMLPSTTAQSALKMCDGLTGGPSKNVDSCYTGVFSEYTNLIGGYDGHTGLPLVTGPPIKFSGTAIKFCSTFEEKYQVACGLEVTGFGLGPGSSQENIEKLMHECTEPDYSKSLQQACLQSMAAVSTQHGLPVHDIHPPAFIFTIASYLRHSYIIGVANETGAFIYNGQQKDWQAFCNLFSNGDDQIFCKNFFK